MKTAASDFGVILFDNSGQAIYLFDKEKSATSACYGACAEAWPPVLTKAPPKALGEVKQSLLGTTKRTDSTIQVTVGGHPLYFYAHEGKNEVKCHKGQARSTGHGVSEAPDEGGDGLLGGGWFPEDLALAGRIGDVPAGLEPAHHRVHVSDHRVVSRRGRTP